MDNKILRNKGQTGDTITWLVATVVIIVVLAISIFATSFALKKDDKVETVERTDVLASKSLFSYTLTKDSSGKTVRNQLLDERKFNQFSTDLSKKVFVDLYFKEYPGIWLGIEADEFSTGAISSNDLFGPRVVGDKVTEQIKISDHEYIVLDVGDPVAIKDVGVPIR